MWKSGEDEEMSHIRDRMHNWLLQCLETVGQCRTVVCGPAPPPPSVE